METTKTISDSEWQVMRIVWADAPVTSTHIINELSKTSSWTPATIKTLLGRLVSKKAIDFEKKKRTFYYFPLITEEECLREENRMFIEKVYGGVLNKETKHFLFYGINPDGYADKLAEALESNYERIISDLQYSFPEKVSVYVHTDLKRFHAAIGVTNAPDWLRASFEGGILHIVPPQYFTDLPADKIALHVLSQLIIHRINFDVPLWLYQGVSAYEGGWLEKSWIKIILSGRIMKGEIPSFVEMASGFRRFGENDGYMFSYTIAQFIIETYGYEKLNRLIREPHSQQLVFGKPEEALWNEWVDFLKRNYT